MPPPDTPAGPRNVAVIASAEIEIATKGPGFTDITRRVAGSLAEMGAADGLCTLFLRHTSASLTIQENADADVLLDLTDALSQLAPQSYPWRHTSEGPDDMPAHVKTLLSDVSLTIPVAGGSMSLGTWQAIYLIEHRERPRTRSIAIVYMGS